MTLRMVSSLIPLGHKAHSEVTQTRVRLSCLAGRLVLRSPARPHLWILPSPLGWVLRPAWANPHSSPPPSTRQAALGSHVPALPGYSAMSKGRTSDLPEEWGGEVMDGLKPQLVHQWYRPGSWQREECRLPAYTALVGSGPGRCPSHSWASQTEVKLGCPHLTLHIWGCHGSFPWSPCAS